MSFTLTVPKTRNFTASSLMYEYAQNTRGVCFVRDRYFTSFLCKNCVWYEYDHLKQEQHPENPDLINVTVFLKERI